MLKIDPVALTDVGRKRDHNEDFLGDLLIKSGRKYGPEKLAEKGYLFAVADGMGGHASGEVASELAITTLFDQYYNSPSSGNIANDLAKAVYLSNLEVHNAGTSSGRGQMGTTLTLALLKGNRALIGNVGDSRTYLIRQGVPLRVTRDHSLVQDQIDVGALTPEQAEHSLIRNVITRAIGHRQEVDADFFEQELQEGDVLLLCSDGLHNLVKEPEMGAIVASTPDLKEAAQQLIDLANERGGSDNISVVLIKIAELGEPLPALLNDNASSKANINSQTVPVAANYATASNNSSNSNRRLNGKPDDEATDRFIPLANGTTVNSFENRATTQLSSLPNAPAVPAVNNKKESRGGAWIITLALLIIIVGFALLYFLVLNPSNNSKLTTTPVPPTTTSAIITTSAISTSVPTVLATVTPVPVTSTLAQGARVQPPVANGGATPVLGNTNERITPTPSPSP